MKRNPKSDPDIQTTNDSTFNEPASVTSMTSSLTLSPEIAPPVLVDAVQMPINLTCPKAPVTATGGWPEISLPTNLKETFQIPKISVSPHGRFALQRKVFNLNGASSYRYRYGIPTPPVSKSLKNQLTRYEMDNMYRLPVTCSLADLQMNSMLGAWCDLISHLEVATRSFRNEYATHLPAVVIRPQSFSRFEVYREYPVIGDLVELHSKLQKLLGAIYAEYGQNYIWHGPRKDNGNQIVYELPVPDSIQPLGLKRNEVQLKLYRKGERLRIEVVFKEFEVHGFKQLFGGISSDNASAAAELIMGTARQLINAGESILDEVHAHLFNDLKHVDIELLWTKLKRDLKFKSTRTDTCFMRLVEDLSRKGCYSPAQHKDQRLKQCRLRKLTNETYGILEEIKNTSQRSYKSYRLKSGWEGSPPITLLNKEKANGTRRNNSSLKVINQPRGIKWLHHHVRKRG